MKSRNRDHSGGKHISRGSIPEASAGRSMLQAEHHRRNHELLTRTRGKKRSVGSRANGTGKHNESRASPVRMSQARWPQTRAPRSVETV